MADLGFRILLIASAVVLVLAVIDAVWVIRTRHAAEQRPGPGGDQTGGDQTGGDQAGGDREDQRQAALGGWRRSRRMWTATGASRAFHVIRSGSRCR